MWTTQVSRVATFPIDYQRVELGPSYPSVVFHAKTSPGSPWVARTLSQYHPWSIVGCRPTQRPSTLLSLRDPVNPVCVSTQLNACCNRAQLTRSLIDTGGGYHLGAPNLTSDHSHPFTNINHIEPPSCEGAYRERLSITRLLPMAYNTKHSHSNVLDHHRVNKVSL
jgi:hypothetical protein